MGGGRGGRDGALSSQLNGDWREWVLCEDSRDEVDRLAFRARPDVPLRELFVTTPNSEDIRYAHPSQPVWLGYGDHTTGPSGSRFGLQWMYTPPPLVFPFRADRGWSGVAVAADPGQNLFSSVSYEPVDDRTFEVVVHYEPRRRVGPGTARLMLAAREWASPAEVVASYARRLRESGAAPSPRRSPEEWWADTFVCTWGEQCNIQNEMAANGRKSPNEHPVVSYESQANQMRWISHLVGQGIPVGVVSTSDKWQRDRYRLIPDAGRYEDLAGFGRWNHAAGRHVIAWWGLWSVDGAPREWCICDRDGNPLSVDPDNAEYRQVVADDVARLLSPSGYDLDGFFLDFTARQAPRPGDGPAPKAGIELLHSYIALVHGAAKAAKPGAMIMTHCPHPYFADVTDVLRLNDWALRRPNIIEQASYRRQIAASCSDWLINTDNWPMYDIDQWRQYLTYQPEIGIPASWFTHGVFGEGDREYAEFTPDDYAVWRETWVSYRKRLGLPELGGGA
jgi:hypothetical protein